MKPVADPPPAPRVDAVLTPEDGISEPPLRDSPRIVLRQAVILKFLLPKLDMQLQLFIERPISAVLLALFVLLVGSQLYFRLKGAKADLEPADENKPVDIPAQLAQQRVPVTPAE